MEPNKGHIEWELMERHFAGEATVEEEANMLAWLDKDPINKSRYDTLKVAFQMARDTIATGGPLPAPTFDAEKDWKEMKSRIKVPAKIISAANKPSVKKPFPIYWIAAAAAGLVLLLAVGYFLTKPTTLAPAQMLTASAPVDSKKEMNLPDGSKVTLAPGATLTYPSVFSSKGRDVSLTGKAYFAVAKDPRYEFSVLTPTARVTVIGTQFLVDTGNAAGDEPLVQVTYGKVKFASKSTPEAAIILQKGEQAVLKNKDSAPEKVTADPNELSWKTGKLAFQGKTLSDILSTLERHYDINVWVDSQVLLNQKYTFRASSTSREEAIESLGTELSISPVVKGDSVFFK